MKYKVEFTPRAAKELSKLGHTTQILIMKWIKKNLVDCENPYAHGKGLTANRSGQWRYRVGDYRLLAEIYEDKIVILIFSVAHRREVYDKD